MSAEQEILEAKSSIHSALQNDNITVKNNFFNIHID
jgi:hypothetical protein